jgi:hypothetical protein
MRAKLTQGFIDDYPPPSNDRVLIWDEDYPGLSWRVGSAISLCNTA